MNTFLSHVLKIVLFSLVVMMGLVPAAGAEDVTLSATFQEPSGQTGAIEVTVELEDPTAASAPPVFQTHTSVPDTPTVPEPSTLALFGLGALGLAVWRRRIFLH